MKLFTSGAYQPLYDGAIAMLKRNETNPLGFFFIGLLASQQGQTHKAAELFSKAVQYDPHNPRYHIHLGQSHFALGNITEALASTRRAEKYASEDALLRDMLGHLFSQMGEHDAAITHFQKAIELNPRWARFHFNLGVAAQFLGDMKTAEAEFRKTVELQPDFYRAWFSLVKLQEQTPEDNDLAKLTSLFENSDHDAEALLVIGHAIAKIYEDLGHYTESFNWLSKAKTSMKQKVGYDVRHDQARFAQIKSLKYENIVPVSIGHDVRPVFIFGLPRSGTTLIDRSLSMHSRVSSAGELNIIHRMAEQKTHPEDIGHHFAQILISKAQPGQLIIDKTPQNYLYAGLISRLFPQALMICVRRGAMDSCLSQYRELFDPQTHPYPYSYDIEDTGRHYREFDGLMSYWKDQLPKAQFYDIRYESVITDQRSEIEQLIQFCELDWEDSCLDFHKNTAPVDSASSVQVRQPLYSASVGRWKKYGKLLSPLKDILGELAETD